MDYIAQLRPVIQAAGDILMKHFRTPLTVTHKPDGSVQTRVDLLVEEFLKQELRKIIPQAGFIAEESDADSNVQEFTWVIDPLDGTRNFVRGLPYFSVSIALYFQSKPICAMTYGPAMGEWFWAAVGQGFWHNVHRVQAMDNLWQQAGIFMVGSSKDEKIMDFLHHDVGKIYPKVRVKVSSSGSLALDLAYVAAGMYDVAILPGPLKLWDVAAGLMFAGEVQGLKVYTDNQVWLDRKAKNLVMGKLVFVEKYLQKQGR